VIEPSYRRLYAYLQQVYLSHANATPGLGALPNGAALYANDVQANTTTTMTPAQIHALGLSEFSGLPASWTRYARRSFPGSLQEFRASVLPMPLFISKVPTR